MNEALSNSAQLWFAATVWPVLAAFAILLLTWLAAALAGRALRRIGEGDVQRGEVMAVLAGLAHWAILGAGVLTALGTLGVDISALVAGLGLTGLTIGFALKDVIASVMAGIMLMIYRPFRRGDRIAVVGLEGIVAGLDLRYTHLQAEGKRYLVPNATVLANAVTVLAGPREGEPA
jgi:small conductance mechanosensitive channel